MSLRAIAGEGVAASITGGAPRRPWASSPSFTRSRRSQTTSGRRACWMSPSGGRPRYPHTASRVVVAPWRAMCSCQHRTHIQVASPLQPGILTLRRETLAHLQGKPARSRFTVDVNSGQSGPSQRNVRPVGLRSKRLSLGRARGMRSSDGIAPAVPVEDAGGKSTGEARLWATQQQSSQRFWRGRVPPKLGRPQSLCARNATVGSAQAAKSGMGRPSNACGR